MFSPSSTNWAVRPMPTRRGSRAASITDGIPTLTSGMPNIALSAATRRSLAPVEDRLPVHVEHLRHPAVIAHGTDETDCAALAELVDHGLEARVACLAGVEDLLAVIVDDRLVGLHRRRALADRDVGGDLRA